MWTISGGKSFIDNINQNTESLVLKNVKAELKNLKIAANENGKNEFYSKDGNKVTYHMDVVKEYLQRLQKRPYACTNIPGNSAPWIMAVQIALESLWNNSYDVGAIDGILWKKTKRAVVNFQYANGLTPDWHPGPNTIEVLVNALNGKTETSRGNTIKQTSQTSQSSQASQTPEKWRSWNNWWNNSWPRNWNWWNNWWNSSNSEKKETTTRNVNQKGQINQSLKWDRSQGQDIELNNPIILPEWIELDIKEWKKFYRWVWNNTSFELKKTNDDGMMEWLLSKDGKKYEAHRYREKWEIEIELENDGVETVREYDKDAGSDMPHYKVGNVRGEVLDDKTLKIKRTFEQNIAIWGGSFRWRPLWSRNKPIERKRGIR